MKRYLAYSLIGVSLVLLTCAALTAVNAMRPAEYDDPFKTFDEIAPGQPLSVLAWGVCDSKYYLGDSYDRNFTCLIDVDDGPFESVTLTASDTEISAICFYTTGLRVGDLVYRWGRPDTVQHFRYQYVSLRWKEGVYAIVNDRGWYTLQSSVKFVAIRQTEEDNRQPL